MIALDTQNNGAAARRPHDDTEANSPDQGPSHEQEEQSKKAHSQTACEKCKTALKNLQYDDDSSIIDIFSEKLEDAAHALNIDLDPLYNYITEEIPRLSGRELLAIGRGNLLDSPNIHLHQRGMSLWQNAVRWERNKQHEEIDKMHHVDFKSNSLIDELVQDFKQ